MNGPPSWYIHGSEPREQDRLSMLNDILNRGYIGTVRPPRGGKILDLGSGLGQFTMMMAEAAGDGASVLGIERDRRQLEKARALVETRGAGIAGVEFREGNAMELRLGSSESGRFDLAHARFLLEHLPEPATVVAGMAKAVRPGGRVFLSDDDHEIFRLTPEPAGFAGLWKAYMRSYEANGNDPRIGRKLVRLLKDAGLVAVRHGGLFFGGCADEGHFPLIADNLIGILEGAAGTMTGAGLIDGDTYSRAMDALRSWKSDPAAAQWYMLCWAEGIVPARGTA